MLGGRSIDEDCKGRPCGILGFESVVRAVTAMGVGFAPTKQSCGLYCRGIMQRIIICRICKDK